MPRFLGVALLVVGLLGLGLVYFSLPEALAARTLDERGVVVEGTVVTVGVRSAGLRVPEAGATYRFTAADGLARTGTATLDTGEAARLAPGGTAPVRYLPEQPTLNRLELHDRFGEAVARTVIGVLLCAGAVGLAARRYRRG